MKIVSQISEKPRTAQHVRQGAVDTPESFFNTSVSGEALVRRHKQAAVLGELLLIKQGKAARDHDLSFLLFGLGLVLSLLMVIVVFEWNFDTSEDQIELNAGTGEEFESLIEIPPTIQPPPPPPQSQQVIITVVNDEIELDEVVFDIDVETTEEMRVSDPLPEGLMEELPEEEVEEVFLIVETMPAPKGGLQEFYKYLSDNIRYPAAAKRQNISGRVYAQFIVENDGAISNIQLIKGIGGGCDEEAIRVLQGAPKWNPGKQRGIPVKVRMTIPIYFTLID